MNSRRLVSTCSLLACASLTLACSDDSGGRDTGPETGINASETSAPGDGDPGDGDPGDGDPGDGDPGDGDPGDGDGDGIKFDLADGGDGDGDTGTSCTADLQGVTDDNGQLLQMCPPDQGCFDGACIPACQAAALSSGSIGCEYWVPTPAFYVNDSGPGTTFDGSCHAVMIANTWSDAAQVTVNYKGQQLNAGAHLYIPNGIGPSTVYDPAPAEGIPPGQVGILFLSHQPDAQNGGNPLTCPVPPLVVGSENAVGTGAAVAFDLVASRPITAYDILPYGGANSFLPSASLLIPRTAWGDNYVLASPHYVSGKLWAAAVAREDGTTVTINTPANVIPGSIPVPPVNTPTAYQLDAGEFLQWTALNEMAGTVIQADKPVGVFAGNQYLRVPTQDAPGGGGQDSAHQQIPHVQALGNEYVGGGIPTRRADMQNESVLYRVVGVVDGTTLSYDPFTPPGAPTVLQSGQAVEFETRDLFVISSQDEDHPFAFTQYMSGAITQSLGGCFGSCSALGDEEWITLVSPVQFLSRYAFFVDPTYGVTTLTMIRRKGPNGYADVELDCFGVVGGWTPVGMSDKYEVAHFELYRNGAGACAQSQQNAQSDAAFGIIVWGQDRYASYGYPAGGNVGTINDVVVPAG